ncbi:GPI transamidase subunit PIG-U isoform 2 [Hibiscus syriacus]|uniref:GPI transamidase subunit PIG-U isoform 2 n=1 Tax=Hibiscus syriacus TaxID=106335 RepID=A0A6A2WQM7_HIBSY|nr:GPI transamidase subunit PIG-U isoform 2 [Hibiscus syriacus]
MGGSFDHLQINSNLLPQKPQSVLSSRSFHSAVISVSFMAEGYWLKQSPMSPYAGSMYHGSPLLLSRLGPLAVKRCVSAMLIRATGQNLQLAYLRTLGSLDLVKQIEGSGLIPLAAFGWVISTHLSLYPAILIIPVYLAFVLSIRRGPDAPPRKLFLQRNQQNGMLNQLKLPSGFSWGPIIRFASWSLVWSVYVLVLCGISLKQFGGLWEMFKSTYGFILTVEDLSPYIGFLWVLEMQTSTSQQLWFMLACLQIVLVVEGVSAMLNHDRKLRRLITGNPQVDKSRVRCDSSP